MGSKWSVVGISDLAAIRCDSKEIPNCGAAAIWKESKPFSSSRIELLEDAGVLLEEDDVVPPQVDALASQSILA